MTEIRNSQAGADTHGADDRMTPPEVAPTDDDGQVAPETVEPTPEESAAAEPATTTRTLGDLLRPKLSRGQLLAAGLCALLGFGAMVQFRIPEDEMLQRARRADLVQILDGLTQRSDRLEEEIAELESTRRELLSSTDRQQTALDQARSRARTLAILAGTAPATGAGIEVTIVDRFGEINSAVLLSAVQELRDAGAEAIQIEGGGGAAVRVVASTYFLDVAEGVVIDGVRLEPPYRILAIGDPAMERALGIPGGVIDSVRNNDGEVTVEVVDEVVIDALHKPPEPKYGRPVLADN